MSNPCIRCGTERIEGKSWKEKNGNFVVTHTMTVCPDKACQKIVEQGIADRKEKSENLANAKLKAKADREKRIADSKLATQ